MTKDVASNSLLFGLIGSAGSDQLLLSYADESVQDSLVIVKLLPAEGASAVYTGDFVQDSIADADPGAIFSAYDFIADSHKYAVDGTSSTVANDLPAGSNLIGIRIGHMQRSTSNSYYAGQFSALLYVDDGDVSDWLSNGRMELESAAWQRLGNGTWIT